MINRYGEQSPLIIRLLSTNLGKNINQLSLPNKSIDMISTNQTSESLNGSSTNSTNIKPAKTYIPGKSTGYPWIDDFTFKLDTNRPLSHSEQETLIQIKAAMFLDQKHLEYKGSNERVDTSKWLDEDGYLPTAYHMEARHMVESRDIANSTLRETLAEQGIVLNDDDAFSITIDFDNRINVHGHHNAERGALIEHALNAADSGKSLMMHIYKSGFNNRQCSFQEYQKYTTNNTLVRYTGYSINQLTVRSDGIFTDDGKNVMALLREGLSTDYPDASHASSYVSYLAQTIRTLNNSVGIEHIRDISLTIDYRKNSLCDINTSIGLGSDQRQWYDQLFALRGNLDAALAYACRIGFLYDADASPKGYYSYES